MKTREPLIFLAGTIVGTVISYTILDKKIEKKYNKLCAEEIDQRRKELDNLYFEQKDKSVASREKPNIMDYANAISKGDEYDDEELKDMAQKIISSLDEKEEVDEDEEEGTDIHNVFEDSENGIVIDRNAVLNPKIIDPYIISAEEFRELNTYEKMDILFFRDGVYSDYNLNAVEIDEIVGTRLMDEFESSEAEEICIRNDTINVDICITRDFRSYDEVRSM